MNLLSSQFFGAAVWLALLALAAPAAGAMPLPCGAHVALQPGAGEFGSVQAAVESLVPAMPPMNQSLAVVVCIGSGDFDDKCSYRAPDSVAFAAKFSTFELRGDSTTCMNVRLGSNSTLLPFALNADELSVGGITVRGALEAGNMAKHFVLSHVTLGKLTSLPKVGNVTFEHVTQTTPGGVINVQANPIDQTGLLRVLFKSVSFANVTTRVQLLTTKSSELAIESSNLTSVQFDVEQSSMLTIQNSRLDKPVFRNMYSLQVTMDNVQVREYTGEILATHYAVSNSELGCPTKKANLPLLSLDPGRSGYHCGNSSDNWSGCFDLKHVSHPENCTKNIECSDGQFSPMGGILACQQCPAGLVSSANFLECGKFCKPGTAPNDVNKCEACLGFNTASPDGTECITCASQHANDDHTACVPCASNAVNVTYGSMTYCCDGQSTFIIGNHTVCSSCMATGFAKVWNTGCTESLIAIASAVGVLLIALIVIFVVRRSKRSGYEKV